MGITKKYIIIILGSELLKNHYNEIVFTFSGIFSQINECYNQINFNFNKDLIFNVLYRGIPNTTKTILEKGKEQNG